jgi:tetratricopeptide (TPR) repeat protein
MTTNDNKTGGDQTNINTGGGDYAGRDIDKRQGTFVTIHQPPSLSPALHQLRAPVSDFVGREREIDELVLALSKAATSGTAAAISGVRGMGGIGKTELAYAVANRLQDTFPDAQLVIELRGASSSSATPEQALQTVIRAFEREAKLPDDLAQLKGVYNSVLAGKRVLILADDAKDTTHVHPLLPPPGCALLVTSRNRFGLPGMAALDLGMLPKDDAEKLLLLICPRIGEHAPTLAQLCGYLALAVRVSASLLANSSRSVERYLEQLDAARLKHLSDPDDPAANVEASLRLSYDALEPAARAALNQMSVFVASLDQAAALAVVEVEGDAEALLDLLGRRSLLEWEARTQRYSLNDLVRAFAAARLDDADVVRLRHARHYLKVANSADRLYLRGRAATLTGLALFDREQVHITTGRAWAEARAGDPDADTLILDYADAIASVGDLRYDTPREHILQLKATLAVAQRLNRRGTEAATLGKLGNAYADLGDARNAIHFYEQILAVTREIGDRRREANALGSLGRAYADLRDGRKAIDFYEQALTIARELGDRRGEGVDLGNLGNAYAMLGEVHKAIRYHEQALCIDRELGDRRGEGQDLCNLGNAYTALDDARKAIDFYEQALAIARELGDRSGEALASGNLGIALEQQGDLARAAELMQIDVDFLSEIGHPDTQKRAAYLKQLRQRLAASQGTLPAENIDEGSS